MSQRRRHELESAEVDVGQALKHARGRRPLDGDQTSVLLELQGDVEPLTFKIKCFIIKRIDLWEQQNTVVSILASRFNCPVFES